MAQDCVFCKIIAKEIPADIVHEDDRIVAFNDVNPQAPVHVLLVPKAHIPTVNDLAPDQGELLGALILRARALAGRLGIAEDGYRLVMNCNAGGGQTVFHIHLHLMGGRQLRLLG